MVYEYNMDENFAKTDVWIDPSPANLKPLKMSILDIRPYVSRMERILNQYEVEKDKALLPGMALNFTMNLIYKIVDLSKAWEYGEEADALTIDRVLKHLMEDMDETSRGSLLNQLKDDTQHELNQYMFNFIGSIISLMEKHLNENRYTFNIVKIHKHPFVIVLEQYDDYRVIQWTKHELEKLKRSTDS